MANNNNLSLIKLFQRFTGIGSLETPTNVGNAYLPVVDVTPEKFPEMKMARTVKNTTGTSTILTTSSTKRTFLTGVYLCYTADATCDATFYSVAAQPKGASSIQLIELRKETTTAGNNQIFLPFDKPIEIQKGTNIVVSVTFTAGSTTTVGNVYYYETDNAIQ